MGTFQTERSEQFDLVVVGGGLSGLCAAVAAARAGVRTGLVQNRSVLGGCASSEIRVPPAGAGYHTPFAMETGIVYELVLADRARNHDPVEGGLANSLWDMTLYEAARAEANLTLLLDTHVTDAEVEEGRLVAVSGCQLGSEIRWRLAARLFVDATGDGAVGAAAGVPFRIGQEARSEYGERFAPEEGWSHTLGNSLHFRARDTGKPVAFEPPSWAARFDSCFPYRPHQHFAGGYWWIELGWPHDTVRDNDLLREELLAQVLGVWDHIKNRCPDTREAARNWALDWVGTVPGRRESRRFVGAHVLNQSDIEAGGEFADTVGFGGWEIDDHTKEGMRDLTRRPSFDGVNHWLYFVRPFGVPLRSLYSSDVPNLMFAGRCMSASRLAFNSLRVMLTLGALGQAAGEAAALCLRAGTLPGALSPEQIRNLQQRLLERDVFLPGVRNEDPADLAREAVPTASSLAPFGGEPDSSGGSLATPSAQLIPVGAGGLIRTRVFMESRAAEARTVTVRLVAAADVWDLPALEAGESVAQCECRIEAGFAGWVETAWNRPDLPAGLYWLCLAGEGVVWRHTAEMTPGCPAARLANGRWWFHPGPFGLWRTFAATVSPDPCAYGAEQVLTGITRPGASMNLWRSDPALVLPASLELAWEEEQEVAGVQLVFDTDLSRVNRIMPPFFRAPECARDYRIEVWAGDDWRTVWAESGNYQRRRVHEWPSVRTSRLRLVVEATNGVHEARLYEIRVHAVSQRQ
jgi:hypothetical protein